MFVKLLMLMKKTDTYEFFLIFLRENTKTILIVLVVVSMNINVEKYILIQLYVMT